MKQFKMFSLVLSLLFIGMNVSYAQDATADEKSEAKKEVAKQLVKNMMALNLSEAQKPSYKEITKRYAGELKNVKEQDTGKFKKLKAMKSIVKRKNEEMRNLLTKDQYTLYLEQQEEMKEEIKEKKNG